jgi:hypothetical protein
MVLSFLFEHSDPRAAETLLFLRRGSTTTFELDLTVMGKGLQKRTRLLRIDIQPIGQVSGHGISAFLAELAETHAQTLPVSGVQRLEDLAEIKYRKRARGYQSDRRRDLIFFKQSLLHRFTRLGFVKEEVVQL